MQRFLGIPAARFGDALSVKFQRCLQRCALKDLQCGVVGYSQRDLGPLQPILVSVTSADVLMLGFFNCYFSCAFFLECNNALFFVFFVFLDVLSLRIIFDTSGRCAV